MNNRKPPSVVGVGLIGLGIILLGIVAGFMLYDRLAGWVTTQPDPPNVVAIVETVAPLLALSPSLLLDAPLVVETPSATDALPARWILRPSRVSPSALPRQSVTALPTRRPAAPAQLIIPKLDITRAIVSVDRVTRNGQTDWDTDKLFATRDRPDLVGHLKGTGGLGAAGNTVLAGHNYNRGQYNWRGVLLPCRSPEQGRPDLRGEPGQRALRLSSGSGREGQLAATQRGRHEETRRAPHGHDRRNADSRHLRRGDVHAIPRPLVRHRQTGPRARDRGRRS